jgi:hypothetical protein
MAAGLLWLDEQGRVDLRSRVLQAMEYYQAQYGEAPNLCLVNPKVLENEGRVLLGQLGNIRLQPSPTLLSNYLWIGQAEEEPSVIGPQKIVNGG